MSEIITVGLDLAKNVFQAHGADASGRRLPVSGSGGISQPSVARTSGRRRARRGLAQRW